MAELTVLLVDDHALFVEAVAPVLAAEPDLHVAGSVGSLAEARAFLRAHAEVDVVVLDQQLPDGAGTHAAAELRHIRPGLRVVIITGSDDPVIAGEAEQVGCVGFVHKGDHLGFLVEAVRGATTGSMIVSPRMRNALRRRHDVAVLGEPLTSRETQVLLLLADGLSNQQICEVLFISASTLRNHVQNILGKLHAHSRLEAVAIALRERLITSSTD